MEWIPHAYQMKAVCALLEKGDYCLFLDPGLGKTSCTLRAIRQVREHGYLPYKKTLVVGPLRVIHTSWPDELAKWDTFAGLTAEVFHGKNPLDIRESAADIILVNFDYVAKMVKASGLEGTGLRGLADFYGFGGLVVDELTAYKSTNSTRYRQMRHIARGFRFRWGLTGSPVANRLEDIFGQAMVIDGGRTFGPYVTHFRDRYFRASGYEGRRLEVRNARARDEIFEGIGRLGLRMSAEDYLDMPPLLENRVRVEMPPAAMDAYRSVERDFVAVLGDVTVDAPTKAAALNKCRQMAGGAVYVQQGKHVVPVHMAKLDAVGELYESLQGKQLLVFVGFRTEAEMLRKRFGAECIIGGTSVPESLRIKRAWDDGDCGMLVAHPASLGHGMNLQAGGCNVCWFTLPWDFEQYDQSNDRLYRQGQRESVVVHKLMASGTVDYYVDTVLSRKDRTQESVFDFLKKEMA